MPSRTHQPMTHKKRLKNLIEALVNDILKLTDEEVMVLTPDLKRELSEAKAQLLAQIENEQDENHSEMREDGKDPDIEAVHLRDKGRQLANAVNELLICQGRRRV